jgi:hypothetical protein
MAFSVLRLYRTGSKDNRGMMMKNWKLERIRKTIVVA